MMLPVGPPTRNTMSCCVADPMLLPRRAPRTSTAALPLTFASGPRGMYAISLHGSKSEYFVTLLTTFWTVPSSSAWASGMRSSPAITAAKNPAASTPMVTGGIIAVHLHPRTFIISDATSCSRKATTPTVCENRAM